MGAVRDIHGRRVSALDDVGGSGDDPVGPIYHRGGGECRAGGG